MAINRRDFLKLSAGSGLLLASDITPGFAASKPLPPGAVGILYDATLCIGCKSCMVNCKKHNAMEGGGLYKEGRGIPYEYNDANQLYDAPNDLSDKSLSIIKEYTGGHGEAGKHGGRSFVKQHCLHCLDPACASVCPVGALHKDKKTGVVSYDAPKCIGCRYCQMACPFGIPKFEWNEASPKIVKCQLCHHRMAGGGYAACCEFCPTGASLFGPVKELRAEAQRRLALTPGTYYHYPQQRIDSGRTMPKKVEHYYHHVYGLTEAGGTQYLMLAGVDFASLGLNPRITDQAYPELTWAYIKKVPILIGLLLVAGSVLHVKTRKTEDK